MEAKEIRKKYLEFFKEKGHVVVPSASLIPENDPSVLFTTAGMHPLIPFLMGEKHPAGKRIVNFQKCIRTGDIDEVGDNHHLTFFEMLGNWSLGDYWKKEAINWSYEFLTDKKWLDLDPKKIAVSVFAGDKDCPFDNESYNLWKSLGIKEERIAKLDKQENWWPAVGLSTGPQGPDTEMFYWTGSGPVPKKFDPKNNYWLEIWNDVFMEYNRTKAGKYKLLGQKNVDTGFGLERVTAVMQNKKTVYETELFEPIINQIKLNAQNYNNASGRIIADHLRAAIFILADDISIAPSNLAQGYVVRKLIRRAIRHAKKIGIPLRADVTRPLVELIVKLFKDIYPELEKNKEKVISELKQEEESFEKSLEKGLSELSKIIKKKKEDMKSARAKLSPQSPSELFVNAITPKEAFDLYSTYGFPLELINEELSEDGLFIDEKEFNLEFKKHQESSRSASAGMFKGGLVGHSEITAKYHTATHLLHQALREVLGKHVEQKGSNITDKRLRFDFSHSQKMTDEEKQQVEKIINIKIKDNLIVCFEEMPLEKAKKSDTIGLFADKYGQVVKVYTIGNFSKEICGGPHAEKTGTLGHFKIIKEEASSQGVRRIKAILE